MIPPIISDAVIRGDEPDLRAILTHCPESLGMVTSKQETALHLALKHDQDACFQALIECAQNLENFGEILNHKDFQGNTVLHVATSRKQIQVIKLLLSDNPTIASVVEVNAVNQRRLTALDLLYQQPSNKTNRRFNVNVNVAKKMILEIIQRTALVTAFIIVAWGTYATMYDMNNIKPEEDFLTSVGIRMSKQINGVDVFNFTVLNAATFIASVVVIVANTWSLVTKRSLFFKAAPVIMCVGYALLVNTIIPEILTAVWGFLVTQSTFWFSSSVLCCLPLRNSSTLF